MMRLAFRLLLLTSLVGSCSAAVLPANKTVGLHTIEFEGHRYVVRVDLDGVARVPLMVHGNSRMYLSLTHKAAERLNGAPVGKVSDYGYSSRGKGVVRVKQVRIGGEAFHGEARVPVFDFTEKGDSPIQGMIGIRFLLGARAAVDFGSDRLLLGVTRQPGPDPALLAEHYRWVPISSHAGGRTTVKVIFPALGRAVPITPSTVANALTLHLPLFANKVPMVQTSRDLSPNGTTPEEFGSDAVAFEIGGVRMTAPASFEDLAEYAKVQERDLETYGMLGFDWMKAHRAVIDYANLRLYFKP